jgi:two-component SAPR family response regulator
MVGGRVVCCEGVPLRSVLPFRLGSGRARCHGLALGVGESVGGRVVIGLRSRQGRSCRRRGHVASARRTTPIGQTAATPPADTAPTPRDAAPATPTSSATDAARDHRPSISILGPLQISGARPRRGRLRTATEQLLVYLVLRPAGATSEELIEAIWPGQDPSKTKPRLWQSAADARKVIGDAFIRDGERYQLDRAQLQIDLDHLEHLLSQAQNADTPSEQRLLEDALNLYRGEPLAGADYPWAEADIRHLNARLVDLLGRTGHARLAHGDPHGALQAAERGVALDEFNESLWRLALQAEHALGMRESVTRRYRELTRTLDEQLGLQPSQETRTVYRQLLGQT